MEGTWASQRRAGPWLTPVRLVVCSLTCTVFLWNTNTGLRTWHRCFTCARYLYAPPTRGGDHLLTSYPICYLVWFWSSTSSSVFSPLHSIYSLLSLHHLFRFTHYSLLQNTFSKPPTFRVNTAFSFV